MAQFDEQNMYITISLGEGIPIRARIDSNQTFDAVDLSYFDSLENKIVIVGMVEFSTIDGVTTCSIFGLEKGGTYNGGQQAINAPPSDMQRYIVEDGAYTFEIIPTPNDPEIESVMDAYNHMDNLTIKSCSQVVYYFDLPPGSSTEV